MSTDANTTNAATTGRPGTRRRQPVPQHVVRRAMTVTGVLTMLLGVVGWSVTAGADPVPASPTGITVTSVPATGTGGCVVPSLAYTAASATVFTTGETWTVTITATKAICDPVTAIVYSMPANPFWPWPQTKVAEQTFDVGPGTTTITFDRLCGPLQFDVVTGAAPASINPMTGPMPGPLLFANPWTGFQSWNAACAVSPSTTSQSSTTSTTEATTTTSTVPESTTSTSTTTSTVPGEVSPSTTLQEVTSTTSSTSTTSTTSTSTTTSTTPNGVQDTTVTSVLPQVLDTTSVPESVEAAQSLRTPTTTTAVQPALAKTGTTERPYELFAALLIVAGAALTIFARRRLT